MGVRFGADASTLVLSPWLSDSQVNGSQWSPHLPPAAWSLCWFQGRIRSGMESTSHRDGGEAMSSYRAVDALISSLLFQKRRTFPGLSQITLFGFSAGCNFLSRWAFFSA